MMGGVLRDNGKGALPKGCGRQRGIGGDDRRTTAKAARKKIQEAQRVKGLAWPQQTRRSREDDMRAASMEERFTRCRLLPAKGRAMQRFGIIHEARGGGLDRYERDFLRTFMVRRKFFSRVRTECGAAFTEFRAADDRICDEERIHESHVAGNVTPRPGAGTGGERLFGRLKKKKDTTCHSVALSQPVSRAFR